MARDFAGPRRSAVQTGSVCVATRTLFLFVHGRAIQIAYLLFFIRSARRRYLLLLADECKKKKLPRRNRRSFSRRADFDAECERFVSSFGMTSVHVEKTTISRCRVVRSPCLRTERGRTPCRGTCPPEPSSPDGLPTLAEERGLSGGRLEEKKHRQWTYTGRRRSD